MSLAEFKDGFYRVVISRAEANGVTIEDFPTDLRTRVDTALDTFYANNTASIESCPGIPGMRTPKAFQVGFELALIAQRLKPSAPRAADWGNQLANRLSSTGTARRRIRIRRIAGALSFEEPSG